MNAQHHIYEWLQAYTTDENVVLDYASILHHVILQSAAADFDMERRSITIGIDSAGKVTADSFKAYNLLRFSQIQFQLSVLQLAGAAGGLLSGKPLGTVLGLLGLLGAFLQHSRKQYQEPDAQVLLCIYRLGSHCAVSSIPPEYERNFGQVLSAHQLEDSLRTLAQFRTIKRTPTEVEIVEHIEMVRV